MVACLRNGLRGQLAGEHRALHAGQVPLLREVACNDSILQLNNTFEANGLVYEAHSWRPPATAI